MVVMDVIVIMKVIIIIVVMIRTIMVMMVLIVVAGIVDLHQCLRVAVIDVEEFVDKGNFVMRMPAFQVRVQDIACAKEDHCPAGYPLGSRGKGMGKCGSCTDGNEAEDNRGAHVPDAGNRGNRKRLWETPVPGAAEHDKTKPVVRGDGMRGCYDKRSDEQSEQSVIEHG